MKNLFLAALVLSFVIISQATEAGAQTAENRRQSSEIAAIFDKTKHKVKEKKGIRVEARVEIKNEPVLKPNLAEYSGIYTADTGDRFSLKFKPNGEIEAEGSEPSATGKSRSFRLINAKIENAVFTATKVYEDGSTEKFEAAFLNRTINLGQNAETKTFGLGVVFDSPKTGLDGNFYINKLFYELK